MSMSLKRLLALFAVLALVVPIIAACGGAAEAPPTEAPAEEETEEVAEEPAEEMAEEPTEEMAEEPTEEMAEEPTEEMTEEMTEEPAGDTGGATVEGGEIILPLVDPAALPGDIISAGSSTVFPLAQRIAEEFEAEGFAGQLTIDSIGSGAGFERFCSAGETDVSNASRPINEEEAQNCVDNDREHIEFLIGIDALAVVVSAENDFITEVTPEELVAIFSTAETWADVNPDWPAEPIERYVPGTDSGTFDYFVEEIFDEDTEPLLTASNVQFSENDNVLVQGIEASPFAVGFFGYAFFEQEAGLLTALAIDGVAPGAETVEDGSYPLARPLFMYSTANIMNEKSQVAGYLNYVLSNVNELIGDVGYFPTSVASLNESKVEWLDAVGMEVPTGYEGEDDMAMDDEMDDMADGDGDAPAGDGNTIVDVAVAAGDFEILAGALSATGLAEVLMGEGPFTVFAPTDDAFAALPEGTLESLTEEQLTEVLLYHVVEGAVPAADVVTLDGQEVATVQGETVLVTIDGENVILNDTVNVVAVDVEASNGIIHVIDSVLLPPSLAGGAEGEPAEGEGDAAAGDVEPLELPLVDPAALPADAIIAAGSSTVFPLAQRIAEEFEAEGFGGQLTIDSIGSGAGFERFCVAGETDVSNASRPIRDEEVQTCIDNGREPIEFLIGIDALAVVVSAENDFITEATPEELAAIFSTAETWADVNPDWPAEPIERYVPGTDSGTFDYFVEEIFEEEPEPLLSASNIQFSEDDNVLVQGVESSPFAVGFFGYAFFEQEADLLTPIAVDGVIPGGDTVEDGTYPLARPLFMYSTAQIMNDKPQVASWLNYVLSNVDELIGDVGYFPTSTASLNESKQKWLDATGN